MKGFLRQWLLIFMIFLLVDSSLAGSSFAQTASVDTSSKKVDLTVNIDVKACETPRVQSIIRNLRLRNINAGENKKRQTQQVIQLEKLNHEAEHRKRIKTKLFGFLPTPLVFS